MPTQAHKNTHARTHAVRVCEPGLEAYLYDHIGATVHGRIDCMVVAGVKPAPTRHVAAPQRPLRLRRHVGAVASPLPSMNNTHAHTHAHSNTQHASDRTTKQRMQRFLQASFFRKREPWHHECVCVTRARCTSPVSVVVAALALLCRRGM